MLYKSFFCLLVGITGLLTTNNLFVDDSEILVLFTNEEALITQGEIDNLADLSKNLKLEFKVHHAGNGLPSDVTTLPSIYFQNRKGRSKYYGRYTNLDRIHNFVRTCKLVHKKDGVSPTKDLLVWKNGKADIDAPLKISPLAGTSPKDFDAENFKKEIAQSMDKGMQNFQLEASHEVTAYSRSFYINVYPYVNEFADFVLTGELFSQYNCIQPIFTQFSPAIAQGKWENRSSVLEAFGNAMETEIIRQIESSKEGDAFNPVPVDVKTISWEKLGLTIAGQSTTTTVSNAKFEGTLPKKWTVEDRTNKDEPIIIFSFLSPVDSYAGEVKALSGDLELSENLTMKGATGKFTVQTSDVTMGAEDFDEEVQNKMLQMGLFPNSQFEFLEIEGGENPLTVGRTENCVVKGKFTMIGISIPITVEAEIEPIVDDNQSIKLVVTCDFEVPLFDKFKIEGPDGPSPAKDVLQFFMKFNLIPK